MSVKRRPSTEPVWAKLAAHGRWYQRESTLRVPWA